MERWCFIIMLVAIIANSHQANSKGEYFKCNTTETTNCMGCMTMKVTKTVDQTTKKIIYDISCLSCSQGTPSDKSQVFSSNTSLNMTNIDLSDLCPKISSGSIVAIVISGIILILLVVFLVICLRNRKPHQDILAIQSKGEKRILRHNQALRNKKIPRMYTFENDRLKLKLY